jgi:DnaJ-class molecular chaperone
MSEMTCPNCNGTGFTQDPSGEDAICPMCDGTGVLISQEGDTGVV